MVVGDGRSVRGTDSGGGSHVVAGSRPPEVSLCGGEIACLIPNVTVVPLGEGFFRLFLFSSLIVLRVIIVFVFVCVARQI